MTGFMSLRLVTTATTKQNNNYGQRFKNSKKSWQRGRDAWTRLQGTAPIYGMFNHSAAVIVFRFVIFFYSIMG